MSRAPKHPARRRLTELPSLPNPARPWHTAPRAVLLRPSTLLLFHRLQQQRQDGRPHLTDLSAAAMILPEIYGAILGCDRLDIVSAIDIADVVASKDTHTEWHYFGHAATSVLKLRHRDVVLRHARSLRLIRPQLKLRALS